MEYKKYFYRGYLQNYIELQLYLIKLSLQNIEIHELKLNKIVKNIILDYNDFSFYIKKIVSDANEWELNKKFIFYTFNEKNNLVNNHINIYELIIREINVLSKYKPENIPLKEIMNKNFLNKRYLFINNNKEEDFESNDPKYAKYRNELINFLFVPLYKETLPQYLLTAQKIYNDYWS